MTSATDSTMDNTFRTAISDGGAAAVADMADFASSVGGTPIADDASWMDQLSATTASSGGRVRAALLRRCHVTAGRFGRAEVFGVRAEEMA